MLEKLKAMKEKVVTPTDSQQTEPKEEIKPQFDAVDKKENMITEDIVSEEEWDDPFQEDKIKKMITSNNLSTNSEVISKKGENLIVLN